VPEQQRIYHPQARYNGLTFGVDGMRLGSYAATGRLPRWYAVTAVQDWARQGNTLQLEVETNDHHGRTGRFLVEFLGDAVVRLSLVLADTTGISEVGWAAGAAQDEGFFGLGERFGQSNHRGHEVVNWIEDSPFDPRPGHDWTYWPVPFFLSSRGYGVLLDTTRRAVFRLGSDRPDAWAATVDGAQFSAVLLYGPAPLEVVRHFTALTGRPPLPPPWAFGVWKTTLGGPRLSVRKGDGCARRRSASAPSGSTTSSRRRRTPAGVQAWATRPAPTRICRPSCAICMPTASACSAT
jgi:hypothetical protein